MTQDWTWRQVDPAPYAHLDARQAWLLQAHGIDSYLVARQPDDIDDEAQTSWQVYAVMTVELEGYSGLEPLDRYATLDQARAVVDGYREQTLAALDEALS